MKRVIVQVVQHLMPGGIETLALELQRCASASDEVHIVSLEGSIDASAKRWPILAERKGYLHFLNKQPGRSMGLLWQLVKLLKQLKPQVVHTHHIGPLLYGGLAARLAGVGVVIHTEHDAWHLDNARRCEVERWALRAVRPKVVADAQDVRRSLTQRLGLADAAVIPNGIDVSRFSPGDMQQARTQLGLPFNAQIVGCAARLEKVKGHAVLLDALFRMPVSVHLALAGDGSEIDNLRQQARDLHLASRVHFLGRVDDMPAFYRAIDVFCLASFNEGMPLSPLEAQACGAPVVMTDVGGARESVCKETGMLVEANNARALAIALKRSLSAKPRTNPRNYVLNGLNIKDTVQAYYDIAQEAAA